MRDFLVRLRERKLVQWAIAYVAGAWLVLQVLDILADPFAWPTLVMRATTVLLAVGFLAALVVAWYHGEKGAQRVSSVEVLMLAGILVIAGSAVAFVGGGPRERPAGTPATSVAAEQGSIAVLPFADMSAARDQEYFADGLTEELLNVLAQLPELRVASRTSAFSFKGSNVPIDSIARALRVSNVLEGSVRKDGDQLRITAQLIDATNGYHLWSETYDRDVGSMFAVQDEIAHAIVSALELRLAGGRARGTLAREETSDPAAHGLVLQATQLSRMSTRPELERGAKLAQDAIARDSSYARAWALLARIYLALGYNGYGDRDALAAQAKTAALRAQTLDPYLADAAHALGLLERDHDWDFRAAEAHFTRAIELSPNMAVSYSHRGWLRAQFGRTDEALADAQRAVTLDPLQAGLHTNLASMYVYDGQLQLGVEAYRKSLALENNGITLANLALSYAELGEDRAAMEAAEQAAAMLPEHEFARGALAYVHARAGRRAEAERYIRLLETQEYPSYYMIASAYAALGDREPALAALEKAMETREGTVGDVGVDPAFAKLRDEPRVQAILKKMKLR